MDIAVGLPNAEVGAEAAEIIECARRAEAAGFSSLGTIDRVAYPNYESLIMLAACATVTERIGLATTILLAPLRNAAVLAKQAATIDAISGGRLTLGLAPGGREQDYTASGADFHTRGKHFDRQLEELDQVWQGAEREGYSIVPKQGKPTLVLGGSVEASFRRAARYGDGWIMGGGTPDMFKEGLPKLEEAWSEAGRDGQPRKMALGYFALGDRVDEGREKVRHYYEAMGIADMVADGMAADADTVRGYASAFEEAGCDEFFFFAAAPHADQVDQLKEALG